MLSGKSTSNLTLVAVDVPVLVTRSSMRNGSLGAVVCGAVISQCKRAVNTGQRVVSVAVRAVLNGAECAGRFVGGCCVGMMLFAELWVIQSSFFCGGKTFLGRIFFSVSEVTTNGSLKRFGNVDADF